MEEHEEQFLSWKLWSQKASAEIQNNKKAQSDKELEMWEGPWQSSAFQVVPEQWEPPVATAVVVSGGWEGAGIVQAQLPEGIQAGPSQPHRKEQSQCLALVKIRHLAPVTCSVK